MAVEVVDLDTFRLGSPMELMDGEFSVPVFDPVRSARYGVGADGQSFFLSRGVEGAATPNRLILIQNWTAELRGRD